MICRRSVLCTCKTRVRLYGQKSVNKVVGSGSVTGSGSVVGSGVVDGSEVVELPGSVVGSSDGVDSASVVVVNSGIVKGSVVTLCLISGSGDRKQRNYFK